MSNKPCQYKTFCRPAKGVYSPSYFDGQQIPCNWRPLQRGSHREPPKFTSNPSTTLDLYTHAMEARWERGNGDGGAIPVPAYDFAVVHAALGEKELALEYLQEAYHEHSWALIVLAVEPRLDPLRSDPRFQRVVEKVGLRDP